VIVPLKFDNNKVDVIIKSLNRIFNNHVMNMGRCVYLWKAAVISSKIGDESKKGLLKNL